MTAVFRQTMVCPKCGDVIPMEDIFGRWIRNQEQLSSLDGFVFMDRDLVVHRYMTNHDREFQFLMFVEVKTHNAKLRDSQKDTMYMIDQVFRNRRITPTKKRIKKQLGSSPISIWSHANNRYVHVRLLGYHLLMLSGDSPDDSDVIKWNGRQISKKQLIGLLRCEIDPDTFRTMDCRMHHLHHFHLSLF